MNPKPYDLRRGCALPRQGVWLRDYEAMPQRAQRESGPAQRLGEVAPSNAYRRRVSGTNWS